jgi:bifunctional non-homologous end joining protein LigD
MALEEYKHKRRFDDTPEPEGVSKSGPGGQLRFVVQRHSASQLHYDFRLELDGVLLSWAVPKGPSLNPTDKRLAMKVEDHPLDYRTFEGTIPKGNYGAGTVMVWDEGTYSDEQDSADTAVAATNIRAGLAKGDLKFTLHGHKLRGSWVLVHTHYQGEENSWLLIKHKDEWAGEVDVLELDHSVLSNRSMDEISHATEQWIKAPELDLGAAPKAELPGRLDPMLATAVAEPFDGPNWLFEVKWDGYRILAHCQHSRVRLLTRNHEDYTARYQLVAGQLANLKLNCLLDGEMVVVDKSGRSDFGALQNYMKTGEGMLVYYVFDLPYANGRDLRKLPLTHRKELLAKIIAPLSHVRLSDDLVGEGKRFFELAQAQRLEGIMAKRADSTYQAGRRSRDWLKVKVHMRQEAVVGGYTDPQGGRKHLGALMLGLFDQAGKLQHIGDVGTGFTDRTLADVLARLKPLERQTSPFASKVKTTAPAHWLKPQLMAEVSFSEWTADGHLRHPVFLGLRDDKDARTAVREVPLAEGPGAANAHPDQPQPAKSKVEFTHLDKVYWPGEGITKGDLIRYYDAVSDAILPHLRNRAESMNRHPNGINEESFFQKNVEKHPPWVHTQGIFSEHNGKDINWIICNDRDTLLYLANLGCIELNPWFSRTGSLEKPDYCLLDIDAKTIGFDAVVKAALTAHELLDEHHIPAYPKTSGKTGLHICIPLGAQYTYEQSKQFAQIIMNLIQHRLPKLTSVERKPDKREKLIYLDYLQNRKGQTMAAPYCVRPVPGATVSTPLRWDEVNDHLDPKAFTIKTTPARLKSVGDLWAPVLGQGIDMKKALDSLSS